MLTRDTSINKMSAMPAPPRKPSTLRHELQIVVIVLVIAGVFGVAVSFLPGIGRTAPEEDKGASQYVKAQTMEKTDPEKALDMFAAIGPDAGEWHGRAQKQVARLQAEAARRPRKPSPQEQADYDALLDFWRKNAGDYEEIIRKCDAFSMAHPRGELRPKVEEMIAQARQGRIAKRTKEAEDVEAAVARLLERKDYGGAILAIEKVSERLRTELDVWPRLAAKRDAIVAEARKHYQRQIEEANRLVKENLKDDARRLWITTLRSFGDGKVPELAELYRASLLRSEEIPR